MICFFCHSPHQANLATEGGVCLSIRIFLLELLISVFGSVLGYLIVQMLGW